MADKFAKIICNNTQLKQFFTRKMDRNMTKQALWVHRNMFTGIQRDNITIA